MKNFLFNTGYFIKETKTIIRMNLLSHILSFLSIGLIFFILSMMISGWWISNQIVLAIQGEAEISVYFSEGTEDDAVALTEGIRSIEGVSEAKLINE
ncbi:MAG: hypothetical protein PHC45_07785, partial [Clostridiaceae bacterium]|nr:hypothetical protein [Clostridiaceae bacterium]